MKFILSIITLALTLATAQQASAYYPPYPHYGPRLSLYELHFSFTGPGCFLRAPLHVIPPYALHALSAGGVAVHTTQGVRVLTEFDPLMLAPHLRRVQRNDMVTATPYGLAIFPRYGLIPNGAVEIFQRPLEAGPCYF